MIEQSSGSGSGLPLLVRIKYSVITGQLSLLSLQGHDRTELRQWIRPAGTYQILSHHRPTQAFYPSRDMIEQSSGSGSGLPLLVRIKYSSEANSAFHPSRDMIEES